MHRLKLSDIAKAAGISVSAVSMALGNYPDISTETRKRVRDLSRQMNYRPRRKAVRRRARERQARKRVKRMALVMVGYARLPEIANSPTECVLAEGARLNCKFEISLIPEGDDAAQAQQLAELARDVDAVLLEGYVRPALLKAAMALRAPALMIGNVYHDPVMPVNLGCQVTVDMRAMGHLAARVLISAGHRRIAFVCHRVVENMYYEQWLAGFRHAHADAGLLVDPSVLLITGSVINAGMRAARAMMALETPPTAAVIPDPSIAVGFLDTLRDSGRELSREAVVIGGARERCKQCHLDHYPNICSDLDGVACATMSLLLRAVEGEPLPNLKILVPFEPANLPQPAVAGRAPTR